MAFGRSLQQLQKLSQRELLEEVQRVYAEAEALDLRRQAQIHNQIDSINRLLKDGHYSREMAALHEELVVRDHKLGMIRAIAADVLSQRGRMGETVFMSGLERIMEVMSPKEVDDAGTDAASDDA